MHTRVKLTSKSCSTTVASMDRLQVQPYSMVPSERRRPFSVPHTSWYSPTAQACTPQDGSVNCREPKV